MIRGAPAGCPAPILTLRLRQCHDGVEERWGPGAAGVVEGDIRVSGHPKVQKTFARVMGYCEQVHPHHTCDKSPSVLPMNAMRTRLAAVASTKQQIRCSTGRPHGGGL